MKKLDILSNCSLFVSIMLIIIIIIIITDLPKSLNLEYPIFKISPFFPYIRFNILYRKRWKINHKLKRKGLCFITEKSIKLVNK
jgi:hypothetical protein